MLLPTPSGSAAALMGYYRFHHKGQMLVHEDVEELLERGAKDLTHVSSALNNIGISAATGYDDPTGWGQLRLAEALKGIEFPKYTIAHFHDDIFSSVQKIENNVTITLKEPIEGFLEKKKSTSGYIKYKADIYKVTMTIGYAWDSSYSIVPTDAQGRKGYWPHNSQSFYCSYDATNKVVEPYTDLQWEREPSDYSGSAKLVGYVVYLRKKKGATKRINLFWPIDPNEEKLLHASFSAYLTKGWPQNADAATTREIQVFPNPSEGLFSIAGLPQQTCTYRIYNVEGREVQAGETSPSSGTFLLDLSTMVSGLYTLQIIENDTVHTKKLIKH